MNAIKNIDIVVFSIFVLFIFFLINGFGRSSNYVASVLMLFVCSIVSTKQNKDDKILLVCFVMYYMFFSITSLLNYQSFYYLFSTCIVNTLLIFMPIFVGSYISVEYNIYQKKKLLTAFLTIWFVIVIVSTITFFSSDNGGRDFASEHTGGLLGGGYCATYGSSLLSVLFFNSLLTKNEHNFIFKLILMLMTTASLLHILATKSTITLIATLLGFFLVVVYHFSNNYVAFRRFITSTLVLSTIFFIINIRLIGLSLMNYSYSVDSELYAKRLYEVGAYFALGQESWHMDARLSTLKTSIETIIHHPLFGIGYKFGNDYGLLAANGIGQHSELLDTFAQCGLIGGIPFIAIFVLQIKKIIKKSEIYITIPFIFTFAILFTFNPFLSSQTNFILFIIIPLFFDVYGNSCRSEFCIAQPYMAKKAFLWQF